MQLLVNNCPAALSENKLLFQVKQGSQKIAVNKPAAFGRVSSAHTELDVSCKHAVTSTGCVFLYYAEELPCN